MSPTLNRYLDEIESLTYGYVSEWPGNAVIPLSNLRKIRELVEKSKVLISLYQDAYDTNDKAVA